MAIQNAQTTLIEWQERLPAFSHPERAIPWLIYAGCNVELGMLNVPPLFENVPPNLPPDMTGC